MTAPDPAFTVHDDADGEPTLWYGDTAVQRRCELAPTTRVGTPVERAERDALRDRMWSVLTAGLAPDETLLAVLDQRVDSYALVLDDPTYVRSCVEDVLSHLSGAADRDTVPWPHDSAEEAADCVMCSPSALAGTSAQARQPTQESGMHEHMRDAAGYCQTCDAGPRSDLPEPVPPEAQAWHTADDTAGGA